MNGQNKGRTFIQSLAPVLIALIIQNAVSIFMIELLFVYRGSRFSGGQYSDFVSDFLNSILDVSLLSSVSCVYALVSIVVFGIWFYRKKGSGSSAHLSMKGYSPILIGGVALFGFGAQILCNYVVAVVGKFFPLWLTEYAELMEKAGLTTEKITPVIVIYAMIAGPIAEELIFRGLTFSKLRLAFGFWTANVIQALLFAGYHMNRMQAIYVFIVGLTLGYVAEKTGNLYVTIILHIGYNCFAFVSSALIKSIPDMPLITFAMLLGSMLLLYSGVMLTVDSAPNYDNEP